MKNKISLIWKSFEEWKKISVLMIIHLFLGLLVFKIPHFSYAWGIGVLLIGFFAVFKTKNESGYAHLFAGYLVGLEVLFRMTNQSLISNPFFQQFAKIGVVVLLGFGLLMEKKVKKGSSRFIFYLLLLLPALFLTNSSLGAKSWWQLASFNLSGPLSLAAAGFYFYKREFDRESFFKLLLWIILPVIALSVFIFLRMPPLNEVNFLLESNHATSGGVGSAPNQVATILCLGFIIVILGKVLDESVTKNKYADWLIALLLLGFGVFTFSRAAPIAAMITILFGFLASLFLFSDRKKRVLKTAFAVILIVLLVFVSLNYASNGMLEQRYFDFMKNQSRDNIFRANISESGARLSVTNLLTGRDLIIGADLQIFKNNLLLGAGAGMSEALHKNYLGSTMEAHTEFTRLLAEHGLFGLAALILLLYLPVIHFIKNRNPAGRIILIFLIGYSFLTMFHSATRLAMAGFIYGLAFIIYKNESFNNNS